MGRVTDAPVGPIGLVVRDVMLYNGWQHLKEFALAASKDPAVVSRYWKSAVVPGLVTLERWRLVPSLGPFVDRFVDAVERVKTERRRCLEVPSPRLTITPPPVPDSILHAFPTGIDEDQC